MFKIFLLSILSFFYIGCTSSSASSAIVPFQHEIAPSDRYAFNESKNIYN